MWMMLYSISYLDWLITWERCDWVFDKHLQVLRNHSEDLSNHI